MKEPIQNYFDIGTIQWMSHPPKNYSVLESLTKLLNDEFFTAIEITQFKDDKTRAKAKEMLDQSGIRVCYGAQPRLLGPGLNPNDLDEEKRKQAESTLIEALDEAKYLGAKGIAFLSGKFEEDAVEESYAQLLTTTRNVCEYAKKKNMNVELEVFDYDVDKKALIGPAPLAGKFAADVRTTHNNFGLIVDLSHIPLTHENSQFVIRTLRPYITHLHIGNAVTDPSKEAYGDLHPRFGFPNSANDIEELLDFFNVVKSEDFLSKEKPLVLSFEVQPYGNEDGDLVIANTKRKINRAWSLLKE